MSLEPSKKLPELDRAVTAFVGLGSNLGDKPEMFRKALQKMDQLPGTAVVALSPLYYSDPVDVDGGEFLNGVAGLQTTLSPFELWKSLEEIELSLGRTAKGEKRQRTIDLDILLHGDNVVDSSFLSIPHPRMAERAFVLRPLTDLSPEAVIPPKNITVARLWERLLDKDDLHPATDIKIAEIFAPELIDEGHR
jgi:2-amino-4-hydroxy-6-hydroxymethyldihydropteridine diphosphokinase